MFNPGFLFDVMQFLKIGISALLFLYTIFAIVILTQVRTMNKILQQPPIEGMLEIIALIHIALSTILFIMAIAIL